MMRNCTETSNIADKEQSLWNWMMSVAWSFLLVALLATILELTYWF